MEISESERSQSDPGASRMTVGTDGLPGRVTARPAPPSSPPLVHQRELSPDEDAAYRARMGLGGRPAEERRPYVTTAPMQEQLGPPLPQTIEQVGGRHFSLGAVRQLRSAARPRGEAADLLAWVWAHAGDSTGLYWRLDGLRAAAWIATCDDVTVNRLRQLEYNDERGCEQLRPEQLVHALRKHIAEHHCQCGAKEAGEPEFCDCLDHAFGKLNQAVRAGALFELREHSREPVNLDNARLSIFSARDLQRLFPAPTG
jgi:hypothetical protein